MSPGPGESWATVVVYPPVRPAVMTAVHHSVFMAGLLAAFPVDVVVSLLVHGVGACFRFFCGPAGFGECVFRAVRPDCLAEVTVPPVEDVEGGFMVFHGVHTVVEHFADAFREEFSHVVHVEASVFEEAHYFLFEWIVDAHHFWFPFCQCLRWRISPFKRSSGYVIG